MASVVRRGDRWHVRWREGHKQRAAAFTTEPAALKAKAYIDTHGTWHDQPAGGPPTLREWAEHHLTHNTRANPDTLHDYRRALERHVHPTLGHLALPDITPDTVRAWVKGLRMADKTRTNTVSLLSGILQTALEAGHITTNPVRSVRLPRTDPPRDPVLITAGDLSVILTELPERWRPLIVTLAGTGMRWGEATALTVGDVDLLADPPVARVTKAVKHGSRLADPAGRPKTDRSVRDVALPPQVVDVLAPLVTRPSSELVFTNTVGKRLRGSTFHTSVWQPALDRAQDPVRHGPLALTRRPRIHDLRAFATTQMIEQGVELDVVADQLGHANISTTFSIYRRVNRERGRKTAAAMGQALMGILEPTTSSQ